MSAGQPMHETAYAKLNLALHVRERMADGYHRLETIFAFAEDGDRLTVDESDRLELEITGPFAAGLATDENNLVLQGAQALRERFAVGEGARLTLEKNLPIAAGLGGGSADAAAALRLLARRWRLDVDQADLHEIAAALGADVPACLFSRPARGEGRGDTLQPLTDDALSGTPVLLVNPCIPLSTAAVFSAWDGKDRGSLGAWREGRNDLEPAAIALVPEIAEVLAALEGADFARMSGSGATCFALYITEADRDSAAASLSEAKPHWWTLATRLR